MNIGRSGDEVLLWRWDAAEPFGLTPPNANPNNFAANTPGTSSFNGIANGSYQFNPRLPGQVYDAETGLHQNWHRDYQPYTGRYIQSDPIGLDGGINTYGYVGGSPTQKTDAQGLIVDSVTAACRNNPVVCAEINGPKPMPVPIPICNDDAEACRKKCDIAYYDQIRICKMSPTAKARKQCYANAADIYAECLKGCR